MATRTRPRKGSRWLGRGAIVVLAAMLALAGLAWWALANDSAATLDALDAAFSRQTRARLVDAERYGADPAQKLELFVPEGAPRPAHGWPLVVFFHGGGWHEGDPHDYRFVARTLADQGYAVALVGYRLNRAGRFPAMLEDSAAGVRRVHDRAFAHSIDPARLVLMGHSAGAYNAVMLALDRRWLADAGLPPGLIAGAVGLAGPYDFYPFTKSSSRNAMGHWPRPEETQPVRYARADAPPLLLIAGTADTIVRPRNTRALVKAMASAGAPTKAVLIDGMGHNGLIITLARPFDRDRRVAGAIFPFLDRVLRHRAASAAVQTAGA